MIDGVGIRAFYRFRHDKGARTELRIQGPSKSPAKEGRCALVQKGFGSALRPFRTNSGYG